MSTNSSNSPFTTPPSDHQAIRPEGGSEVVAAEMSIIAGALEGAVVKLLRRLPNDRILGQLQCGSQGVYVELNADCINSVLSPEVQR